MRQGVTSGRSGIGAQQTGKIAAAVDDTLDSDAVAEMRKRMT